ncbi:MAG: single-stranded-DNA-specific exonuclease RecJ [Anaerolineaceae bacterium]|nr:single-stranded-DNA-specific exonuclease RecJ [Anaerolineaceae bacterium]
MLAAQNKRWEVGQPAPLDVFNALAEYPPVFRQVLYNRGIFTSEDAQRYLHPEQTQGFDPFLLKDMPKAVERVLYALDQQEKVVVYGDYDVDGVTATALLVEVLAALGANVNWHIPNRFDEGYGLNNEALHELAGRGVDLVITVDCGIRSPREANLAAQLGLDLIVTDHHHPAEELPEAAAVICHKQDGDGYPDKDLAGVGLAYKLAEALLMRRPLEGQPVENWLDLVALGTVADVVPLLGENRRLVRLGLARLRQGRRQGLLSLAGASGLRDLSQITAGDIGFVLGPRLNAAGRMDTALDSLRLLLERDPQRSGLMAQQLDGQNRDRQKQTVIIQEAATAMAQEAGGEDILFAFSPDFSAGLVGLAASRLVDAYYRPAVVGHIEDGHARASCRSIPEFHITQALDECRELLVRHGGHSVAAGFTVQLERLEELKSRLAEIAQRELGGRELVPVLKADAEIELDTLSPDLFGYLDLLEPTGQSNSVARFVSRNVRVVRSRTVGADAQHLKLTLSGGRIYFDAIAFRQGHWFGKLPETIDILYTFERNVYNGNVTMQLNIKDLRPYEG